MRRKTYAVLCWQCLSVTVRRDVVVMASVHRPDASKWKTTVSLHSKIRSSNTPVNISMNLLFIKHLTSNFNCLIIKCPTLHLFANFNVIDKWWDKAFFYVWWAWLKSIWGFLNYLRKLKSSYLWYSIIQVTLIWVYSLLIPSNLIQIIRDYKLNSNFRGTSHFQITKYLKGPNLHFEYDRVINETKCLSFRSFSVCSTFLCPQME